MNNPVIDTSQILWIIGGFITLLLFLVKLFDYFATKKHDINLSLTVRAEIEKLEKAIKDQNKDTIQCIREKAGNNSILMEKYNDKAENRDAALVTLLNLLKEKLNEEYSLVVRLFQMISADSDWGKKLEQIAFELRDIKTNQELLREIKSVLLINKDTTTQINTAVDGIEKILTVIREIIQSK